MASRKQEELERQRDAIEAQKKAAQEQSVRSEEARLRRMGLAPLQARGLSVVNSECSSGIEVMVSCPYCLNRNYIPSSMIRDDGYTDARCDQRRMCGSDTSPKRGAHGRYAEFVFGGDPNSDKGAPLDFDKFQRELTTGKPPAEWAAERELASWVPVGKLALVTGLMYLLAWVTGAL